MRKVKRFLMLSVIAVAMVFGILSVNAGVLSFSEAVPIFQGWKELSVKTKDSSSYMSGVILTRLEVSNAVQFEARGKNSAGNWNGWYDTTTVHLKNANFVVYFDNNYGAGTQVQARFRNYNWNLDTGVVAGTWQYF